MVAQAFPVLSNEFEDESQPMSMDADTTPTKTSPPPLHPEYDESDSIVNTDKREELQDYILRDVPPTSNSLENRVAYLEEKLAALSRLLPDSPVSPAPRKSSTAPHLESPCPAPIKRHLSHVLLRDDSPPQQRVSQLTAATSCPPTPPPMTNLVPKENDPKLIEESPPPPPPSPPPMTLRSKSRTLSDVSEVTESSAPKRTVRQKWMDYLESFQESTPDVDSQMEEFVKVPSQLEGLLTFGLFICLDSYLYILTMLPIKVSWGVLLGLEGFSPRRLFRYQFHRRYVVCVTIHFFQIGFSILLT